MSLSDFICISFYRLPMKLHCSLTQKSMYFANLIPCFKFVTEEVVSMKILFIVAAILLSSIIAFAQQPPHTQPPTGKGQKFETVKQRILGDIDARVSLLQQEKGCVSAAQNVQDLKNCREQTEKSLQRT
jgi:hypothetical protein